MLARTTPDVCNQRLFGGKYVDHSHVLKENLRVSRAGNARRHENNSQQHIVVNGLKSEKPNKYGTLFRAQAILTPVSDPTPTMEKVRTSLLHTVWAIGFTTCCFCGTLLVTLASRSGLAQIYNCLAFNLLLGPLRKNRLTARPA